MPREGATVIYLTALDLVENVWSVCQKLEISQATCLPASITGLNMLKSATEISEKGQIAVIARAYVKPNVGNNFKTTEACLLLFSITTREQAYKSIEVTNISTEFLKIKGGLNVNPRHLDRMVCIRGRFLLVA